MGDKPLVSVVIPTHNREEKLIRLINSILQSDYPKDKTEIIVVDDVSTDGTYKGVREDFPEVRIIRNEVELLLAESRNVGLKNAKGNHIFLIDDDNIIAPNTITELIKTITNDTNPPIGVVAPIMYYLKQPNRVWCAGIKRSMVTSLTKYIGRDEIDSGVFKRLIESKDFPNSFLVKKEVIKITGLFDEKTFPIHYDEADFGERVRKASYKVVCNPRAKVWHDITLPEGVNGKARLFHCHSEFRAYYCGRNRILFHRKYSKWWQFLIFILIFNWLFTLYYLKIILLDSGKPFEERVKIAKSYLKGSIEGVKRDEQKWKY